MPATAWLRLAWDSKVPDLVTQLCHKNAPKDCLLGGAAHAAAIRCSSRLTIPSWPRPEPMGTDAAAAVQPNAAF